MIVHGRTFINLYEHNSKLQLICQLFFSFERDTMMSSMSAQLDYKVNIVVID